ncbi:hypothetical protein LOK49_LG02G01256 [Camellia lanceoleosa]|uniref:Uncharacterized protein n=1 Tax=Camellia lanceoleosa TaxID=1840588 RepID=A0ACC0IMD2_9ERIC|nr:hypothetical protein LOK49_LG02G01256 [Camellia lanceoleosa]
MTEKEKKKKKERERCVVQKNWRRAGVEIQKGDPYSYHRNWRRVRRSNGETSYEEAAVLTAKRKDAITKVILLDRQVEKVRHNPRPVFITHFSHRHALHRYKMLEADEDLVQCGICYINIVGEAWGCQDCEFFIHKSCKDVPREIRHNSQCGETLTLRSYSRYEFGMFCCDACLGPGAGFHYHCSPCMFDLHVACAGTPYTVYYEKHKKPLTLCYDFPIETSRTVYCNVCWTEIDKYGWAYYNKDSHFIAHIYCAFDNEEKDSIQAIQNRLQWLQIK